jgi:phosphate ABC transporter phosphate-binding protein
MSAGRKDRSGAIALRSLLALLAITVAFSHGRGFAQSAALRSVHTVFVPSTGRGGADEAVRKRLVNRLEKSGVVRVVDNAASADAVLRSNAVIWPTGTVSPNPRSASVVLTNYQGYLSAELISSSDQTLWSYLVTPGRFRMSNIVDDLADHLSAQLIAAIKAGLSTAATGAATSSSSGVSLQAAGATFPAPLYRKWFESFRQDSEGFPITYDAVGSVAGLNQLATGKIDVAASDIPAGKDSVQGPMLHFPTVVGGVVPIYNLRGNDRPLNFTPQVLAEIYSGKIQRWNDPRIRRSNGGAHLPDAEITVIHRSDGSGTTYAWTNFLAESDAEWKGRTGASVEWPVGIGAQGNEGMADEVAKTPNSIGYVELIYAIQHQLSYAAVENPAGRFVRADLDSITAAAENAHGSLSALNAAGRNAYPITTFTWFVVPVTSPNTIRRAAISTFLRWMLTTGQKESSALGYAPLPREIVGDELRAVDKLKQP